MKSEKMSQTSFSKFLNAQEFKPTCDKETWIQRMQLLQKVRSFFESRHVLEVETPILSQAVGTDPNLDYFQTLPSTLGKSRYLMTSPEFHLKRLLASGFGDVYSIARSFRLDESGERHNSEFTLVEWYRIGMPMEQLMEEVEALCSFILNRKIKAVRTRYTDAFKRYAEIDFNETAETAWVTCCLKNHVPPIENGTGKNFKIDEWRDYVMACVVEPKLGMETGEFIYDYPAHAAALAKTERAADGSLCAKRFELYLGGTELCNGYQELTDFVEQKKRFEDDLKIRQAAGKHIPPIDTRFLEALHSGMPECSGVALGLDRLFMLALQKKHIQNVILFPDTIA